MDWHSRFLQQAGWTRNLREYLFRRAGLSSAQRVLEVGCGTGAVLMGLDSPAAIHGLDIDRMRLLEAHRHVPSASLVCGDGLRLPYAGGIFDLVFCHFFLLWSGEPAIALMEMKRVCRSGGAVLALAEPDHESRTDEPEELQPLGRLQTMSLRRQGADIRLGSRLADLFSQAGIAVVETGSLQPGSTQAGRASDHGFLASEEERDLEWAVLEEDLGGLISSGELSRYKELDRKAWHDGTRRLHVPTHFAWGRA
jgi:SAM-dependent methyltransferase